MNLLEIIFALHGKKSGERRRILVEKNVDMALWSPIQSLFAQNGQFVDGINRLICDFAAHLNKQKPS